MSSDANDELARTATAHGSQPEQGGIGQPRDGDTIGRYRLERTLGVGGMGVVHVAFDPDLERRVALKVLRAATGEEAAKRLQREARAMARLNHPNVVTVHEVGSVAGRDYVAMELIDGESLAEWLRAERRDPRAVVDSFIAAGRGLAAAHVAGIVHRDFKPHNVLRSRSGRIAVTDFGLAREAQDPLAVTMPLSGTKDQTSTSSNTPSSLSGLTMSGSVLGTPAYMAPEQWEGGEVTPATDQFGFCVALWEALSGERPYRGPTVDDLRAQVAAGPQALDASKIPRRLRSVLRRGLDPDRAKRWPSMDALLAELSRAQRQRWMLFAALGAGVIAAAILVIVLQGASAGSDCPAPALDPAAVWNDDVKATVVAAGQAPAAKLFDADHRRWLEQRATACGFEPGRRVAVLGCLDGVLARFDAAARGATKPGHPVLDVGAELVNPAVCGLTTVPRLVTTTSPQFHEVVAARMRDRIRLELPDEAALVVLAERSASDPCAEAIAQAMLTQVVTAPAARDRAIDLADQAADRCGDDRIRAELAITSVSRSLQTEWLGTSYAGKLARAESAVQRVAQTDLNARLAEVRMLAESRAQRIDSAIEQGQAAVAGYASRGRIEPEIRAGVRMLMIRQGRANPEDLAAIAS
ncbi:MAG: serine/threonine protein kinase, partial [Deltaproteobacteria bacterium]|nr:serine/threonine protein kinase [Deltaproteobacteria bacterium]